MKNKVESFYLIRMFICEWMLELIISIAPKEDDGIVLVNYIYNYCKSVHHE